MKKLSVVEETNMCTNMTEPDLVVQMLQDNAAQAEAEQRARFNRAIESASMKYRLHRRARRRVYYWLNQLSMILVGATGVIVAALVATDHSWRTLVAVLALALLLSFGQWCSKKSRRSSHG